MVNKYAIKVRATTAKDQGAMRRTTYGEHGLRYTQDQLMKKNDQIFPKYKPKGSEVFGKPLQVDNRMGDIVTGLYANEFTKNHEKKT